MSNTKIQWMIQQRVSSILTGNYTIGEASLNNNYYAMDISKIGPVSCSGKFSVGTRYIHSHLDGCVKPSGYVTTLSVCKGDYTQVSEPTNQDSNMEFDIYTIEGRKYYVSSEHRRNVTEKNISKYANKCPLDIKTVIMSLI